MKTLEDPNVLYGGDPDENTGISDSIMSIGDMILSDLKLGEDKTSFVILLDIGHESKVICLFSFHR